LRQLFVIIGAWPPGGITVDEEAGLVR